MQEATKKPS